MARGVEIRGLPEVHALLNADVAKQAAVRTINDLTTQSRTRASTAIRARYTVKAATIKNRMKVSKITTAGGVAKITVSGPLLSLTSFAGTRQTAKGVSVKILQSGTRKLIRHAFLAQSKGSQQAYRRVWRREHPAAPLGRTPRTRGMYLPRHMRYPVERLTVMYPATMFDQDQIYGEIQALLDEKYEEIFLRNFEFYAARV